MDQTNHETASRDETAAALRAVLDMHSPTNWHSLTICAAGDHGDPDFGDFERWPCATARAAGVRDDGSRFMNDADADVHGYFALTYSSYLVLHRSALQSMPASWQVRFVALLAEIDEQIERHDIALPASFDVVALDEHGDRIIDRYRDYDRGRRRLWSNTDPEFDAALADAQQRYAGALDELAEGDTDG